LAEKYYYPILSIYSNPETTISLGLNFNSDNVRMIGLNENPDSFFYTIFGATAGEKIDFSDLEQVEVRGEIYNIVNRDIDNLVSNEATIIDDVLYIKQPTDIKSYLVPAERISVVNNDVYVETPRIEHNKHAYTFPKNTNLIELEIDTDNMVIFGAIARNDAPTGTFWTDIFGASNTGGYKLDFDSIYSISYNGIRLLEVTEYPTLEGTYQITDDFVFFKIPARNGIGALRIEYFVSTEKNIQTADNRLVWTQSKTELQNDIYNIPKYTDVNVGLENTDNKLNRYVMNGVLGNRAELSLMRLGINESLGNSRSKIIRNGLITDMSEDGNEIKITIADERRNFDRDILNLGSDLGYDEIADEIIPIAYGRNKAITLDIDDGSNRFLYADPSFANYLIHSVYYKNDLIDVVISASDYDTSNGIIDFREYTDETVSFIANGGTDLSRLSIWDISSLEYEYFGIWFPLPSSRWDVKDNKIEIETDAEGNSPVVNGEYLGEISHLDTIRKRYEINKDIYCDFTSTKITVDINGGVRSDSVLLDLIETYTDFTYLNDFNVFEIEGQNFHKIAYYINESNLSSIIEKLTQKAFLYFFIDTSNRYTIRQYDYANTEIIQITASISQKNIMDNRNYASTVYIRYACNHVDETYRAVYNSLYANRAYKNYKSELIKKFDTCFILESEAQAVADFMASRLSKIRRTIEIETDDDIEDISLYDIIEYDGMRGNDRVLQSNTYRVWGLDLVKNKIILKFEGE